jgi:APA family basic amino acid/polyamine antiporter
VFAILVQGLVAMVMTFTSFPSLVLYVGFLLNFFAAITVASLFVFRRRPGWRKLPATSFLWPLVPSVFMLVSVWMTLFGLTLEKKVAAVAVATVALGAAVFHFRLKSSHAQTAGR